MSTRPPPSSRPPPYAMVSRVYKSSLRPVVVVTGLITAGWTLVWGIGSFQEINVDKDHGQPKFATLAIALGALYMTVCVIELYGVIAAVMQKLILIKSYAFLSILSSLIVVGAAFLRTIVHFIYKNQLIDECTDIVTGTDVVFRFGIWGPAIHDTLNKDDAEKFCKDGWNHDSFSEIISLIIELVLAAFFVSIAFAYYHQTLNPAFGRSREFPERNDEFPEHYAPPYLSYDQQQSSAYAPPAGPPPGFNKAPAYDDEGYGVGARGLESDVGLKGDDPFADFDGPGHGKPGLESRDTLV